MAILAYLDQGGSAVSKQYLISQTPRTPPLNSIGGGALGKKGDRKQFFRNYANCPCRTSKNDTTF